MSGDDGVGVITSQHCCQTATAIQLTPMDICLDTWVYFQLFLWGQCRLFLMETYRHLLLFLWWPRPALFPLEGRTAYIHEQNRYFKPKQFSMNLCVVLQKYFLLTFSLAIQLTFHCVHEPEIVYTNRLCSCQINSCRCKIGTRLQQPSVHLVLSRCRSYSVWHQQLLCLFSDINENI